MDDQLIGREREQAQLRAWVSAALAGRGSLVLLAGEAGVGKTSLAREALAGSGLGILEGFGVQGGTSAFGPVVEALRSHRRTGGGPLLEGPLAAHLALLLPELGPPALAGDRATLFEAIRQALAAIAAGRPSALFLDDLQWADDATLELLGALARSVDAQPLLLLGAFRSDELPRGHPIRPAAPGHGRAAGGRGQRSPAGTDAGDGGAVAAPGGVRPDRRRPLLRPRARLGPGGERAPGGRAGRAGAAGGGGRPDPRQRPRRRAAAGRRALRRRPRRRRYRRRGRPDLRPRAGDGRRRAGRVAGRAAAPRHRDRGRPRAHGLPPRPGPRGLLRRDPLDPAGRPAPGAGRAAGGHPCRPGAGGRALGAGPPARPGPGGAAGGGRGVRGGARLPGRRAGHPPGPGAVAGGARRERPPGRPRASGRLCRAGGDLAEAVPTWREVADGRRRAGDLPRLGTARRRLAAALKLQGRWQEALAGREQAAVAFTAAGLEADAAAERLASAAHLRSAGSFRAALSLLETAGRQARAAGRVDLQARILGQEGNVRARMGEGQAAVELVRAGLAMALEHGLTGPAAEIYQRLADALEHTGDYPAAKDTYDEAFSFCAANALDPIAQLCLACLTAVLRQSGDWDRAVTLCRQVIASAEATFHARAVATGMLGSILGLRGQPRQARPLLLEALTLARRIELAAMELLATWGLAIVDQIEGATSSAAGHCWAIVERWRQTEDRHYAIAPLRWATTFFSEVGDGDGTRTCAAALAQIDAGAGQAEAMSALAHALGETALLDGDAEQAADQFGRALALLQGVDAPFDRAESERRAGAALALAGRREEAVEHLVAAHRTARRLGARPLMERVGGSLAALGEQAERRLGRRAVAEAASGSLSRREVEVVRLVAMGHTNREIARELFLSPRTVEMHVGSILLKLDCRSRADAARRASELGLLSVS